MSNRYRIEWQGEPKMWLVVDSQERGTSFLGHYYGVSDAQHVADKLNERDDLLAALEAVTDPLHQCEKCDDHYGMTHGCTPWAQVRAAVRKAKNLQSEEAWDEWLLSRWKAGGAA